MAMAIGRELFAMKSLAKHVRIAVVKCSYAPVVGRLLLACEVATANFCSADQRSGATKADCDYRCPTKATTIVLMAAEPLIITYLEMRSRDQLRPKRADTRFQVREKRNRDWRFNRDLYFRVGEQWNWIDKRLWTDEQWKEYAAAAELCTFAGYYHEVLAGYYELRRDKDGEVEIAYFGLLSEFIGRGLGGPLLTSAIEEAWARRGGIIPTRVWVHTCNRDHPQALANYEARGMLVYKVEEEL
jgi:GNAT superfamily N-acetyltransferase